MTIKISPLSGTTVRLEMQFKFDDNSEATDISIGTGFFWTHQGKPYLITNKHNLTGKHFETEKCLSKTCAIPNILKGYSYSKKLKSFTFCLPLNQDNPNWLEDNQNKSDIVAISLEKYFQPFDSNNDNFNYANEYNSNAIIRVSLDVFVLGYPKGLHQQNLPIWKRASIATEPNINAYQSQPSFLIDTATKQGMSGSPVYFYAEAYTAENGDYKIMSQKEPKFLGIYSGRLGDNELETQLGIVWKKEAIENIFKQSMIKKST